MNRCFEDGDLRAFADGELPVESLQEIAGHLEICPQCSERHREISERAARVYGMLSALSETGRAVPVSRPRPRRLWQVAVLAVAAALAMAFVLLPKHAPVRPVPVAQVAVPPAPIQTATTVVRPAAMPPAARRTVPRRPAPTDEFVRLDDEPIETATLVRVSADNGALQADLILGPDGRAHAIRVVRNQ